MKTGLKDLSRETGNALEAKIGAYNAIPFSERRGKVKNEEIEFALELCATGDMENCEKCPYSGRGCDIKLTEDTIKYIEDLKSQITVLSKLNGSPKGERK